MRGMMAPEAWTSPDFDRTPCAHCHSPLGQDECADESGAPSGVHAECWSAWCADRASVAEDRIVDREREREWADNAADTDSDTATSEGGKS